MISDIFDFWADLLDQAHDHGGVAGIVTFIIIFLTGMAIILGLFVFAVFILICICYYLPWYVIVGLLLAGATYCIGKVFG